MAYIQAYTSDEIYHHGIKGQRWGVRRYQNEDGSLTAAGRKKYRNEKLKMNEDKYEDLIKTGLKERSSDADKIKYLRNEQRDLSDAITDKMHGFHVFSAYKWATVAQTKLTMVQRYLDELGVTDDVKKVLVF